MQRTAFVALIGFMCSASQAELVTVSDIVLDGFQSAPQSMSPGTGIATMLIDTVSREISITGSFEGLQGEAFAAHLHGPGGAGQPPGIVYFGLILEEGDSLDSGTFHGTGIVNPFRLNAILNSESFINVHTSAFPTGEILGNVNVPGTSTLGALGLGGLVATRRRR